MVDIDELLPELRNFVETLTEDMRNRVADNSEIQAGLNHAYKQIEKGGRTAQAFESWLGDYLDQVAVAWVLSCVFVRFMEDNGLIDECYLAGEGDRRNRAEDSLSLFFREHPNDEYRDYFLHVFREVGKIPACIDLFAEGKTPVWALGPTGDAAMQLLEFWREIDPESGALKRTFETETCDTRFLGDLYQELSIAAQKKYALKQTPVFVEEFILDRTFTPALEEFALEEVRLIDPTCGSGHFLLGAFDRLFKLWTKRDSNEVSAAQKALDGVWGVDINPFAVAIARFRLIVASLSACGLSRLQSAPGWTIHLAVGDSLLFGSRWTAEGEKVHEQQWFATEESWAPDIYACEDQVAISEVLGQQYHAVVGNPPYINARDSVLNQAYRDRYKSCGGRYSLGVPFTERFFDLAINSNGDAGYVGMITTNSFMKRAFGKNLIHKCLPNLDLTHLIDSAGAYIPGHGTPTVIIFGRNRKPVGATVRGVLGIKGEPTTPKDPAKGKVWKSIVSQIDIADAQDDYTSTSDIPRTTLAKHPWSLAGGGAAELKERLDKLADKKLEDLAGVGVCLVTLEDDAYRITESCVSRLRFPEKYVRHMVVGNLVRDWIIDGVEPALFPHNSVSFAPELCPESEKWLWAFKTNLSNRLWFRQTQLGRGLTWFEYGHISKEKLKNQITIVYPEIASHNHFCLCENDWVFDRTAPVVKPADDFTRQDVYRLLGFLNSSLVCFWMKQVAHQKQMTGGDGVRIEVRSRVPYQFATQALRPMPIPKDFETSEVGNRIALLAEELHSCASQFSELDSGALLRESSDGTYDEINSQWEANTHRRSQLRSRMLVLQEEIDFCVYSLFGLVPNDLLSPDVDVPSGIRPGQRAFEIRQGVSEDDYEVPASVPDAWPESVKSLWDRRIAAMEESRELRLIEDAHYKRRWIGRQGLFNLTKKQGDLQQACKEWLLNRLESSTLWSTASPKLKSLSQITDVVSGDERFRTVGSVYRGREDYDLATLVRELIEGESVPSLPCLVLKASGLRKLEVWERTWKSQRLSEDEVASEIPDKFTADDYKHTDYKRLRGTLGTHLERFVSHPYCEREGDQSLIVGWAGWDHVQQATAMVAYYDARKREGWTAERLKPLLAGIDQLLPWIHQWHPEIDPEYNETAGTSFQTLLESEAQELGLTLEDIRNWTPPKKTTRRKKKS